MGIQILISSWILTLENPHQDLCLLLEEEQSYAGGAVIFRSIKHSCIADSTMEAEYVAACEAAKEAVWLCQILIDLEVFPSANKQITIYCDNSGAVANSREPRNHKRGKHIERKYHLLREIVHRVPKSSQQKI